MKNGLTKKRVVLNDLDQLLLTLKEIDTQIQTEVEKRIHEECNQNINSLKGIEDDISSFLYSSRNQQPDQLTQIEKEHSYHLTLSY